jgi:hypothetical protein
MLLCAYELLDEISQWMISTRSTMLQLNTTSGLYSSKCPSAARFKLELRFTGHNLYQLLTYY